MLRTIIPTVALMLALPLGAQAASLAEFNLEKDLKETAEKSSQGTPRLMDSGLTDNGFSAEGRVLTNHLVAPQALALDILKNKEAAASVLGRGVCSNKEFRTLLANGAIVRLDIKDDQNNITILSQDIVADNCRPKK